MVADKENKGLLAGERFGPKDGVSEAPWLILGDEGQTRPVGPGGPAVKLPIVGMMDKGDILDTGRVQVPQVQGKERNRLAG